MIGFCSHAKHEVLDSSEESCRAETPKILNSQKKLYCLFILCHHQTMIVQRVERAGDKKKIGSSWGPIFILLSGMY
jgi:hypothetical protein